MGGSEMKSGRFFSGVGVLLPDRIEGLVSSDVGLQNDGET
jgi:hypothetical protein